VSINRNEAQKIAWAFMNEYPSAFDLAFKFRKDTNELYERLADKVPRSMKGGYVPGAFIYEGHTRMGRVDVALENIKDNSDLLKTLRHEVLGHFGINTFSPAEKRTFLDGLMAAREEPSLKPLWNDVDRRYKDDPLDIRAEEVFALHCEGIAPSQHQDTNKTKRDGEKSFYETCIARVRPMQASDLQNITCMVAQGLKDRTRKQQTFPYISAQFRKEENKNSKEQSQEEIITEKTTKQQWSGMDKRDQAFCQTLADKVINMLETGAAFWQKLWEKFVPLPLNTATDKEYQGINTLQLMSAGYSDNRWMTYNQAQSVGAQVREGQHGRKIRYTKHEFERVKHDENGKPVRDEKGKTVKETIRLARPQVFFATVFNADQIENMPEPTPQPERRLQPLERTEKILLASGASIHHEVGKQAFYNPITDSITLPKPSQSTKQEDYYATALRELVRWTGHSSRLNRGLEHAHGNETHAKEELKVAIASMMLGNELGIGYDPSPHEGYVDSWIKVLKNDPVEIYRAATDAGKIYRHIMSFEHKQTLSQEQEENVQQTIEIQQIRQPVKVFFEAPPIELLPPPEQVKQSNDTRMEALLAAHDLELVEEIKQAAVAWQQGNYEKTLHNFDLPEDWTGELRVVGIAQNTSGQWIDAEKAGVEPSNHMIYARKDQAEYGEDAFIPLGGTLVKAAAESIVEQLHLMDALAKDNPYQQSEKLAFIEYKRIWNNPNISQEEKIQARVVLEEVRDIAQIAQQQKGLANSTQSNQAESVETLDPETTEQIPEIQDPTAKQATAILNALIQEHGWKRHEIEGKPLAVARDFEIGGKDKQHSLVAGYQFDVDNLEEINLSKNNRNIAFNSIADWESFEYEPQVLAEQISARAARYADEKRVKNGLEPKYQSESGKQILAAKNDIATDDSFYVDEKKASELPQAQPLQESQSVEVSVLKSLEQDNQVVIEKQLSAYSEDTARRIRSAAEKMAMDGLSSHPVFGQILPDNWTGEVKIMPSVRATSGQILPADQVGEEARGYAVYVRKGDSSQDKDAWQAIVATKTQEQAQARAEQLQLLKALITTYQHKQILKREVVQSETVDELKAQEKSQIKISLSSNANRVSDDDLKVTGELWNKLRSGSSGGRITFAKNAGLNRKAPSTKQWQELSLKAQEGLVQYYKGSIQPAGKLWDKLSPSQRGKVSDEAHSYTRSSWREIQDRTPSFVHRIPALTEQILVLKAAKNINPQDGLTDQEREALSKQYIPINIEKLSQKPDSAVITNWFDTKMRGFYTNAHIADFGGSPPHLDNWKQQQGNQFIGVMAAQDFQRKRILSSKFPDYMPIQILAEDSHNNRVALNVPNSQEAAHVNTDYLQYFLSKYPGAELKGSSGLTSGAINVHHNGEVVGSIALLNLNDIPTAGQIRVALDSIQQEKIIPSQTQTNLNEPVVQIPQTSQIVRTEKPPIVSIVPLQETVKSTTPTPSIKPNPVSQSVGKTQINSTTSKYKNQQEDTPAPRKYLAVTFHHKEEVKELGACWDKEAKCWYAEPNKIDMDELTKFFPENIQIQATLPFRAKEELADTMRNVGMLLDSNHPIMDGKGHRVAVEGGKKGARDGFYVIHLERNFAFIENHKTGVVINWKSKGTALTAEHKAKLNAEAAQRKYNNKPYFNQEKLETQQATAQRISRQWKSLRPVEQQTPYLERKGIATYNGVMTDKKGKTTFISALDTKGKHWTTQYIQEDGIKRFAKDGRKTGCFHPVGGMEALKAAPVLVIAEGYATAASLAESTGHATVAAFDSSNLIHVASALHEKYPNKPIIIAGDDDRVQEIKNGKNPGRSAAEAAAKLVNGTAIFPIFAPQEQKNNPQKFTDYNDLANNSVLGREGVKRQVNAAISKILIDRENTQKQAIREAQNKVKQQTSTQRLRR